MRTTIVSTASALLLSVASPSAAQDIMEQQRRCSNVDNRVDLNAALAACAAVIESGRLSGADLARIWYNRGSNYLRLGNANQAVAALTESIRLNPGYAPAFANRGVAYRMGGMDATDRVLQ